MEDLTIEVELEDDFESRCETCAFYSSEDEEQGTCRKYAPRHIPALGAIPIARWPRVRLNEWCGEYEGVE